MHAAFGMRYLSFFLQVLNERERAKREADMEVERVARVKEMEATMERLRKVGERLQARVTQWND